jgi:hypothetical protein
MQFNVVFNTKATKEHMMHVLIVTFQLTGLSEQGYQQQCEAIAPLFTALPDLSSKTWLANTATN